MYEDVLIERLKNLYDDLTCSGEEAISLVNFMTDCMEDKVTVIRDLYFHDHAPVKVLNPQALPGGGHKDPADELIEVSIGYDNFVKNIGVQATGVIRRHTKALNMFLMILSLPTPYSSILYLHYFKKMSIDDTCKVLYISRSSCYRKRERAIKILNNRMSSKI
ncbi:MAG: DUF1492 domain-containing protein [Clostridiales bacterium]|nr:DUF1492 domain-containing protein [Clostridiales bacterium]